MELTKGAADNYHRSWWKRHGVVLEGEIAALCFKIGNYDLAAKSYEKVCALYAGEGWQDLLAEVLPNLVECQKILNDQAGYLASCVRLLSLDNGLFSTEERQAFQSEVVRLAHSEMKHLVPLDVSSLITFPGNPGPPLELCDGDPGTLSVTIWSGFPDDIPLESLSLTLMTTYSVDEGVQVYKPRPLVNIVAAVSSALLMNELQGVGLIIKPLNYTLKGDVFHIATGPDLRIEESHMIEVEDYTKAMEKKNHAGDLVMIREGASSEVFEQLQLQNGKLTLPDWSSDITSVLWLPVCAVENKLPRGTSAVQPQQQSVLDGMRTIALKD